MLKNAMDLQRLLEKDVQDFIHGHKSVGIKALSLAKMPFEGELRLEILQQIQSCQKALSKLPEWTTRDRIIFPKPDLVEQASSGETAAYKASICPQGNLFLDLTAGMGSDSLAMSDRFTRGILVDADPRTASILAHNMQVMTRNNLQVVTGLAEEVIHTLPDADLIYLDPQRRIENGKKGLFNLRDTKPDVLTLLPVLKEKAPRILIKTSPFLDISEGLRQLGDVAEVHVVEAEKQCKEVLYLIDQTRTPAAPIIHAAVCSGQVFSAQPHALETVQVQFSDPLTYLYEPCAALMKAGTHSLYASELGLQKLAPATQLYTSDQRLEGFMGRGFKVIAVLPADKKDVHAALPEPRASITVRNFPMTPDDLRRKLQLKDGGHFTIFACTFQDGSKRLILCEAI